MWSCWCLCMLMVEDGWCLHFSAWHLKGKDLWALWVATWCQVLDACDVAKEPFVFYGAKLPRLPRTNLIHLSFTVTNTRTWCIDFNPPLFAWICPAPMSSLWQLGEVLVPSLVAFETSFIISRIEATSGSITETKTFTTLSPCLSDSAHGAHGAHGARCMHPPIESFCVCWHMLARLSFDFPSFVSWGQQRSASTSASSQLEAQILWTGAKLDQTDPPGWRAKSAKWIVWRCLEFYHEAHYRYYSRIEVIQYFYVFFILGTSVKEITGDAHNPPVLRCISFTPHGAGNPLARSLVQMFSLRSWRVPFPSSIWTILNKTRRNNYRMPTMPPFCACSLKRLAKLQLCHVSS